MSPNDPLKLGLTLRSFTTLCAFDFEIKTCILWLSLQECPSPCRCPVVVRWRCPLDTLRQGCRREAAQSLCVPLEPAGVSPHGFCQLEKETELCARTFSAFWNSRDKITVGCNEKAEPFVCCEGCNACGVGRVAGFMVLQSCSSSPPAMRRRAEPCSWHFSSSQSPSQMQQQKTSCTHFSLQGSVARLELPGARRFVWKHF